MEKKGAGGRRDSLTGRSNHWEIRPAGLIQADIRSRGDVVALGIMDAGIVVVEAGESQAGRFGDAGASVARFDLVDFTGGRDASR